MQIAKHTVVDIDYILTNDQGEVLDTSQDRGPLSYLHGVGGLIPGLERALDGKTAGDQLEVAVSPDDGYGQRNESLRQTVSREEFGDVEELQVGMQFRVQSNQGPLVVSVVEFDEQHVTLDGNHPLAGVALNFAVTIRGVRAATEEELAHGHAHGPGGHAH